MMKNLVRFVVCLSGVAVWMPSHLDGGGGVVAQTAGGVFAEMLNKGNQANNGDAVSDADALDPPGHGINMNKGRNSNEPKVKTDPITLLPVGPTEEPTSSPAPSPSPSEAPTFDPGPSHFPTMSPSEDPTSSPAPSPSPSEAPTLTPSSSPSSMPSAEPTESQAPSTSPSSSPSFVPSDAPSQVPSDQPSLSLSPSNAPTEAPSTAPSDLPSLAPSQSPSDSVAPSDIPSMTPSVAPSIAPSDLPSLTPSGAPSTSPTSSPTTEAMKTKTAVTNVFLPGLTSKMDEMDMAFFELSTLQFIKDTRPYPTMDADGYEMDVIAVTVLTQEIIFPEEVGANTTNNTNRLLQEEMSWISSLQVEFRTVGVLTNGRVPASDWDFSEITDHGFVHNYDQYLWELGSTKETNFFEPLKAYSNGGQVEMPEATPENGGKKGGKFAAALLLSFLAIGIAVFASYFAIRQHMQKKNRRKNRQSLGSKLSHGFGGRGHSLVSPTRSMSHDRADEESGAATRRFLAAFTTGNEPMIDIDEQSLESVGLTPRNKISPRMGFASPQMGFGDEGMPSESLNASPTNDEGDSYFGSSSRPGTFIKKWLTPRRSASQFSNLTGYSTTTKTGLFDPPEDESTSGYKDDEPKDSRVAAESISEEGRKDRIEVNKGKNESGNYTVPVTMFGKDGTEIETPLASFAASSNFMNGMNSESAFTGVNSSAGGLQEANAFSEATGIVDKTSKQDEATSIASHDIPKTSRRSEAIESKIQAYSNNFESDRQTTVPRNQDSHSRDVESQAAVEVTLGARSMSADGEDEHDLISPPKYRYNMSTSYSTKRSSSIGMKSNTGMNLAREPVRVTSTITSGPGYHTLGARPMGTAGSFDEAREEEDQRSTLSSVIKRAGAYDVYAPSGPIGIVVDTSKEGPSVHSLKSHSPMMGLITPGDLIIALDDIDTRNMSAAALTRLMAKKSRQRERKITLFSVDGY